MAKVQKITTFLWFDNNAEEAMNFYTSIFKNSRITNVMRCGDAGPGPKGSVLTGTFELDGQQFIALNGGPVYKFTEAISLLVSCKDQAEVDELWAKLTANGGSEVQCGWLKDKFGLSWQIVPDGLLDMLQDQKHPTKAARAFEAMMTMVKLDLARVKEAYDNG